MDIDVTQLIGATNREVAAGERDGVAVQVMRATRTFDTRVEDLWEAITTADRIPRWFLPISGDLRLGGRYQIEGHAGGEITRCDPPEHLAITWESGGDVSWVTVALTPTDGATRLELSHTVPVNAHWDEYGAGAVGLGWDLLLMGLQLHLPDGRAVDPDEVAAWQMTEPARDLMVRSGDDWCRAAVAGGADAADAEAKAARTLAAYTGG